MDDETLDRLVEEARRGDSEAFGRIFDEYAAPIHRFIASRVRSPTDAEDLTQLVFVKALEALPRYEARGIPFGGWLFRLARNAVIDQVRTRRDYLPLITATTRATDEAGPEAMATLREDLQRVARAMSDLTDDQREVIELRFRERGPARGSERAERRQPEREPPLTVATPGGCRAGIRAGVRKAARRSMTA